MALTLVTSDLIHGLDYSKLTGTITTWNQDTTGNADTATLAAGATILATARNIGGVSFNGSAAINLPGVNTAGNQNTSGVAATATLLATARTIGGVSFNGSTAINLPGVNIAGNQNTSGNAGTVTNGVYTVGNQTIGGVKTFSGAVNVTSADDTRLKLTDTGDSSELIFRSDGANTQIYTNTAHDLGIYTANNVGQLHLKQSNGNVGIGTASPSSKLHIRTSTNFNYEFEQVSSKLRLSALNDARNANIPLHFAASEFNFITGNVGIGTSSNAAMLRRLNIKPTTDVPQLYLVQNNNDAGGWMTRAGLDGHYHLISYQGSENELLTLRYNTGNLGIGTTSPSSKLHLRDAGTNSDVGIKIGNDSRDWNLKVMGSVSDSLQFSTHDNSNVMTILPSGNVGIGTSSPERRVHINGAGGSAAIQIDKDGDRIAWLGTGSSGSSSADDTILQMHNEGVEKVRIFTEGNSWLNGGNVGIGTTSPGEKLEVAGHVKTPEGIISPVFYVARNYATAWGNGGGYNDITEGGIINILDHSQSSLLSFAHGGLGPVNNGSESMTWNYFKLLFRFTDSASTYTNNTVGFKTVKYMYNTGWVENGAEFSGTGMDGARGPRWAVSPWVSIGSDVPGIGLKYYNNNAHTRTVRVHAIYIQYKS
jgi:hypothetical protein